MGDRFGGAADAYVPQPFVEILFTSMVGRILRSLMTLIALVVVYQGYVLLAVPWLEPAINFREQRLHSAEQRASANPVTKYQRLLSHYFPSDHWSLARPPVVISTGQVMFVLDGYKQHDDGRLDIERCALLVFPTPHQDGVVPPGDAILVEAPGGAKLQFEDFRPERVEIGQITRGEFPGKITIRSGMRSEGPEDDLLVETADLAMNSKLLYTTSPVRFRMGKNVGRGREMEIRFLEDEHSRPGKGMKIAGVASLEVRREVRLRLFLETASLLPGAVEGDEASQAKESEATHVYTVANSEGGPRRLPAVGAGKETAPMEVSCSGPFHFDFLRYIASFDSDVELRQVNPDGPSDQLTAQQLDVHFSPLESGPGGPPDSTKRQGDELSRLQAAMVVAQGHPVVVVSPARAAEARGEKIQIDLRDQRVTIEGGRDVRLTYGANVLRAPLIDYQHPTVLSGHKIGNFRATGPGTLLYLLDPAKPNEVFTAAWEKSVALARENGRPVITLAGRPQLSMGGAGRVSADEMRVQLNEDDETTNPGAKLPGGEDLSKLAVRLERMTATGDVQIESPQFSGKTARLDAEFEYAREPAPSDNATPYLVAPGTAKESKAGGQAQLPLRSGGGNTEQTYFLETDRLSLKIGMQGQQAAPRSLVCTGNVVFREVPLAANAEKPLEIRGGELEASNLDTAPHITIRGGAPGYSTEKMAARFSARGIAVSADVVELDQAENRLWIDGPGRAAMSVTRDVTGKESASPYPIELEWQGGLNFDGTTIVFQRDVLVEGPESWLRCNQLAAKLTAPVAFGSSIDQDQIDVREIECSGDVVLDHRTRDELGPTSHQRIQLPRLVLNQQTGDISGDGPGIVRSAHFSNEMMALGGAPGSGSVGGGVSPPPGPTGRPRLHFLRIDFQRRLSGNLYVREMTFEHRVRTVYGPIDSWQQELSTGAADALPPESMQLSCESLRINEDVAARAIAGASGEPSGAGPVQLTATGNVRIEGQSTGEVTYGAAGDRASYDQSKERFILEGNARTPATLWQRRFAGDQSTPNEADRIEYDRLTGKIKVVGIRSVEISPPTPQPRSATGIIPRRQ